MNEEWNKMSRWVGYCWCWCIAINSCFRFPPNKIEADRTNERLIPELIAKDGIKLKEKKTFSESYTPTPSSSQSIHSYIGINYFKVFSSR